MIAKRLLASASLALIVALFLDLAIYHRWWFWALVAWTLVGILSGLLVGALASANRTHRP